MKKDILIIKRKHTNQIFGEKHDRILDIIIEKNYIK